MVGFLAGSLGGSDVPVGLLAGVVLEFPNRLPVEVFWFREVLDPGALELFPKRLLVVVLAGYLGGLLFPVVLGVVLGVVLLLFPKRFPPAVFPEVFEKRLFCLEESLALLLALPALFPKIESVLLEVLVFPKMLLAPVELLLLVLFPKMLFDIVWIYCWVIEN